MGGGSEIRNARCWFLSRIGGASEGMKNWLKSEVNNMKVREQSPAEGKNAPVSGFQAILPHLLQLKIVCNTLCIVEALVKQTWWYVSINFSFFSPSPLKPFILFYFIFFVPSPSGWMTYRKIPVINTYTAEQPEKEQEVIPTVTSIAVPDPEGDKLTSLDHVDVQLDSKSRGSSMPASSFFAASSSWTG